MEQTKQQCQYKREEEQLEGVDWASHRQPAGNSQMHPGSRLAGGREPQLAAIEAAAAVP